MVVLMTDSDIIMRTILYIIQLCVWKYNHNMLVITHQNLKTKTNINNNLNIFKQDRIFTKKKKK